MADFHELTDQDMVAVAKEAIRTGVPLDDLVSQRLFNGRPPKLWGDWPPESVALWDAAVSAYRRMVRPEREDSQAKPREKRSVTIRESWVVIESMGTAARLEHGGDAWWLIPYVTWPELAAVFAMSAPALIYRFSGMGWSMDGSWSARRVVTAPCLICGKSWPAEAIEDSRGRCCEGS